MPPFWIQFAIAALLQLTACVSIALFCPVAPCLAPQAPSGAAPLRALGEAIRGCLAEWFSVGLLQLRRLTWEGSSAGLLEKASEAG